MPTSIEQVWTGVNEAIDPENLAQGFLSFGKNIRVENGSISDRGGHIPTTITNELGGPDVPSGLGETFGSCEYKDETGLRSVIVFCANAAVKCTFGTHARVIFYPSGLVISSKVQAVQCDTEVRVITGKSDIPLVLRQGETSFVFADQSTPPTSYERMSGGKSILYFLDRVWVFDGKQVKPSLTGDFDLYDPVKYIPVDIGANDEDGVLALFDQTSIVVTNGTKTKIISNITSDLSLVMVEDVSDTVGCSARLAPIVDNGVMLLPTTRGIFPITRQADTRISASTTPMSEPIKNSYDEIDFSRFNECASVAFDGYYYISVPMESGANGRVFVYSTKNNSWMGYDEQMFSITGWARLSLGGQIVLCCVTKNGFIFVYGYDEHLNDGVSGNGDNPTESMWVSRGFGAGEIIDKKHISLSVKLQTQNPNYTIGYVVDGVSESGNLSSDNTRSSTKYSVIGKTDFDGTNVSGDFLNPYRQDYTLFSNNTGFYIDNNSSYIYLDKLQDSRHGLRITKHGRFFQVVFKNKRGRCKCVGIDVETIGGGKSFTSKKTN